MCCTGIFSERQMELFEGATKYEEFLIAKADVMRVPIGGTMELLPLCNMDCRMCYVRMTRTEMEAQGKMLSCDEWLAIARSARDAGVLFLLITGGEPLMYPEFRRLYTALTDMGFIITINTNGTLIDEDWADFFAARPCRRMNITLYGQDDATYADLCRNPIGFTQVSRAARLLKERDIPFRFNFTCTPYNLDQLPRLHEFARELGVPLAHTRYCFPPARRGEGADAIERLTPERCAEAVIIGVQAQHPGFPMDAFARMYLSKLKQPRPRWADGARCRAAISGFWINWKGQLLPCGMFDAPAADLTRTAFSEAWPNIVREFAALPLCDDCENCAMRNLCMVCFAACHTETGTTAGRPDYLCRATRTAIELLLQYLPEAERQEYRDIISPVT